jgi:uncharacterized membrane protein
MENALSELVVIGSDDPHEADRVLSELQRLQKEYLVDLMRAGAPLGPIQ